MNSGYSSSLPLKTEAHKLIGIASSLILTSVCLSKVDINIGVLIIIVFLALQCANRIVSAQKSLVVVKTKIELDSHADASVVNDQCLVIHYHNIPANVYGYDP